VLSTGPRWTFSIIWYFVKNTTFRKLALLPSSGKIIEPILSTVLYNLYTTPNIIRIIKSKKMRWAEHVARMWRIGMHIGYWWESQNERDH
jgi:hypothetical protein